ncbi:hypothetical protein [Nostoc sp. NMS8]|uniref:hypothetical protein n=1 Tax=Nostoc sp. NMS8 TaxID=2815392 RepID=UPI0025F70177|nr:hypothetical protein [Nostoc sp. NMS8]MBN3957929.1 hypothetical protein [Nostoc sp. NMS8]
MPSLQESIFCFDGDLSTQSRDLIDLAILRVNNEMPARAIAKAEESYKVKKPLIKAITNFTEKERYRDKFFQELNIPEEKFPIIMDGIKLLSAELGVIISLPNAQCPVSSAQSPIPSPLYTFY